jgi:MFS transporter, DHA2 family, multidrug resistance protein
VAARPPGAGGDPTLSALTSEWQPGANPWLIAISVMLATFMEVLDTSVANVSLPHIGGSFAATPEEATWVLTSYLVSNAVILPTTAWLAGTFGRKRVLIVCIFIFTAASAVCGAATSLGMLIVARVVQGVGGGALQPIAQAVLLESFPPARRGVAMAVFAMGIIVAPILGPTLGGFITDEYSWRWVFYINLPVGAVAVLMAQAFIEDPPYIARPRGRIDYIGFALLAVGLGTLQLVLDKGQEDDWLAAVWIRWFLAVSMAALVLFVVRELLVEHPIVDLRVFRNRNFAVGTLMITILGMVLYGTTAMLPLFLQTLLGYTAVDAGLAVSPRGLGALVSSITVGRLVGLLDPRLLMMTGFGIMATSGFLFSRMSLDVAMSNVVWTNILNGSANPLVFIPMSTTTMSTLRNHQIGNATGIYNLMRNIGASIGIAAMTTLLARGAQHHQAILIAHATPYEPAYRAWLDQATAALSGSLGPAAAAPAALGLLYRTLLQQATLLAYLDNFRWISLLAILCAPLVLLFRKGRVRSAGPVH